MKKQEKIFEVENLTAKIKESKSIVLADYKGLTANQFNQLRSFLRQVGGEVQVVKNTLFLKALAKAGFNLEDFNLEGPSVVVFAKQEEIEPLKTLVSFGKPLGLLALKFGIFDQRCQDSQKLLQIANLPGKDTLKIKLISTLNQPLLRLTFDLSFNLQKLVNILKGGEAKLANN